jgi:hypothetical protein
MSDKNWPVLIETGMHIVTNPDEWGQMHWSGPRRCFGGRALTLSGFPFVGSSIGGMITGHADMVEVPEAMRQRVREFTARYPQFQSLYPATNVAHAGIAATVLLGLTFTEAGRMFSGMNRLNDIRALLGEWAAADGVELPPELRPLTPPELRAAGGVWNCECPLCVPAQAVVYAGGAGGAGNAAAQMGSTGVWVPDFLPSTWEAAGTLALTSS